jgi:methanogenic corrinoid protein MtbC1
MGQIDLAINVLQSIVAEGNAEALKKQKTCFEEKEEDEEEEEEEEEEDDEDDDNDWEEITGNDSDDEDECENLFKKYQKQILQKDKKKTIEAPKSIDNARLDPFLAQIKALQGVKDSIALAAESLAKKEYR